MHCWKRLKIWGNFCAGVCGEEDTRLIEEKEGALAVGVDDKALAAAPQGRVGGPQHKVAAALQRLGRHAQAHALAHLHVQYRQRSRAPGAPLQHCTQLAVPARDTHPTAFTIWMGLLM